MTRVWPFLVLVLACGDAGAEEGRRGPPAARVTTGPVTVGAIDVRWTYFGEVEPLAEAELAAGAEGTVGRVAVRVGDRVTRGQVLMDIDTSLVRARLQAAQLERESTQRELEQAQRDAERFAMAGRDVVSEAEIEQARSRAEVLATETRRLEANTREIAASLRRHRVTAPFDGVVSDRRVDPGDWVSPGTPALVLVADDAVQVRVDVLPEAAELLAPDAEATLIRGDARVPAVVRGLVRALDPATRTVRVRLEPTERPRWLVPGTTVDVEFEVRRSRDNARVVPLDAVVTGAAGGRRVVRVNEGKAQLVTIELLASNDGEALVVPAEDGSLSAGDQVVTRGNERLRPEQALTVLEE